MGPRTIVGLAQGVLRHTVMADMLQSNPARTGVIGGVQCRVEHLRRRRHPLNVYRAPLLHIEARLETLVVAGATRRASVATIAHLPGRVAPRAPHRLCRAAPAAVLPAGELAANQIRERKIR